MANIIKCADCGAELDEEEVKENCGYCAAPLCQKPLCPVCIDRYLLVSAGQHICKECAEEYAAEGFVVETSTEAVCA